MKETTRIAKPGRHWAQVVTLILIWLFVLGITVQVLLVGLSLLSSMPMWRMHVDLGHSVGILAILALIFAHVGRLPRPIKMQLWGVVGIYIVQAEVFAMVRSIWRVPAAFHPVLAMVLFWLTVVAAQNVWTVVRARRVAWQPGFEPNPAMAESVGD